MYNKYVSYYNTYIYCILWGLQLGLFFRTDAYRDVIFQRQGGLAHSGSCLLLHALWRWKAWNSWSITQWIGWNCTAASKDLQSLLPKRLKNRLKDVSIHQVRSKSSHGFDLAPWCWTRCTMHNEMMSMTAQTIWTSTPQRNTENKSKRKLNSKPYSRNKTSVKTIQPMKARKIIKTMKTMKWVPGRETTIVFVLPYGTGVFVHSSRRLTSNEIATSNSICLCSCMSLFSLSWRALHSWGQREQRKSILAKTSKQHIIKNRFTKQNKLTGRITRKKKTSYKIKK